jgi:FdhD protein
MSDGVKRADYLQASTSRWMAVEGEVIEEAPLTLYINGQEWVTLMCTPTGLEHLVLGFLSAEGIVNHLEDVSLLDITHRGTVADVWLHHQVSLPQRRVLTSGCAGGITFADLVATRPPIHSRRQISRGQVLALMGQLQDAAELYRLSQGVHTSALSDGQRLLSVAEDVGRHNTLDKIRGECLKRDIQSADNILLTTGRISSEMLRKAADMEVPIVISRTSPTSLSLNLAEAWGMTLIGYVRGRRMRVYTGAWRLGLPAHTHGNNGHNRSQDWAEMLITEHGEDNQTLRY